MDHTRKRIPVSLFDRNTVPSVSHGNNRILQFILVGGCADNRSQLVVDFLIGLFHRTPDALKGGRSIVADFFLRNNAAADFSEQVI